MHELGLHPGATWKKCDFQVHTPRDPNWDGSSHLAGGTPEGEQAREAWADDLIAQCIATGLDAIAITDHHDFAFVPYVRRAAERAGNLVWVFPGVEVTCNDAVQCLVVFDSSAPEDKWNRLFGGHLQNIPIPLADADRNPAAVPCGNDIDKFIESVCSDAVISKISIVLPHASNDGAHKSMMRQGFHTRFANLPFDGVYTDKAFGDLDASTLRKIQGKISQWGDRRRGLLATGDNRVASWKNLGAHACWVRLGEPTAESIRQAVLADEARIAYEPPALPSQRIVFLEIDSKLTGPDFRLTFNDGFTALIGGRGAGKSALLEYLRFGLGRSSVDMEVTDDETRRRERSLIEDTLENGSVRVTLERDGVRETWTRYGAQRELIQVQVGEQVEQITVPAAQRRFRGRAFYQKQLSTLVSDERTAGEQITGIAAAQLLERRRIAENEIEAAKRAVSSGFRKLLEYWVVEADHQQAVAMVSDLERRLAAINASLAASGLSPEAQAVIAAAPSYDLAERLLNEAMSALLSDQIYIQSHSQLVPSARTEAWLGVSAFPELVAFADSVEQARGQIRELYVKILAELTLLETSRLAALAVFLARQSEFSILHARALDEQRSLASAIAEQSRLSSEYQSAQAAKRSTAARIAELGDVPGDLARARGTLQTKQSDLTEILREAARQVETMSAGSLRASVHKERLPHQCIDALLAICDGNRIRDVLQRCEDHVSSAIQVGMAQWNEHVDNLVAAYRSKVQTQAPVIEAKDAAGQHILAALFGPLTPQQLAGVYGKLSDALIDELLVATHNDVIIFEYKDRDGFMPFDKASPGQQAAALLQLLLNQEAGTLIVDQPEDDLDNKVIMSIVTLLQTTKRKRQIIFATHNPNFVVNGDADKIVTLSPGSAAESKEIGQPFRVSIEVDGAIETPQIRTAITDTMEGGQRAFELRGRKYQFNR